MKIITVRTWRLPDCNGQARYRYKIKWGPSSEPSVPGVRTWPLPSVGRTQRFGYVIDPAVIRQYPNGGAPCGNT